MKHHRLHCQDPWFTLIKEGRKPIEGRKNLPKFKDWRPGDRLMFELEGQSFETEIIALRRYKTLEDYLSTETLGRTLPGVETMTEGIAIYLQWSSRVEIERYGFLAIEVKLL